MAHRLRWLAIAALLTTGASPAPPPPLEALELGPALPGPPRFGPRTPLWPGEAPSFGASVLIWKGWLYAYAGGAQTHLARVRPQALDRPARYAYWDGRAWAPRWQQAAALPGSGPELS